MNIEEYNNIKNLNYLEYCTYLQNKYGLSPTYYFTQGWSPIAKCKRTKEGLLVHHKYENKEIRLCKKEFAMSHPYEWHSPKNLVYCDYLEHLFLHILICESDAKWNCGIGGIINFLVPELNDYYSGYVSKQEWQRTVFDKVKNDFDVYKLLLERFVKLYFDLPNLKTILKSSSYQMHDIKHTLAWTSKNNIKANDMIDEVFKKYE